LCAAEVGSNDRFLIHKRTFGEAAANDRFWPIPAVAFQLGRMTASGHKATLSEPVESARFRGLSGRNPVKSGHANS
jgi:hypothetical protein